MIQYLGVNSCDVLSCTIGHRAKYTPFISNDGMIAGIAA